MIKKEINEIKSLYDTIQDCGILRLAGCYVNGDKAKVKTFNSTFLNLPEEEMYNILKSSEELYLVHLERIYMMLHLSTLMKKM